MGAKAWLDLHKIYLICLAVLILLTKGTRGEIAHKDEQLGAVLLVAGQQHAQMLHDGGLVEPHVRQHHKHLRVPLVLLQFLLHVMKTFQ